MSVQCGEKPAKLGEPWSPEDLGYLSDHYGLISNEVIARHLKRTEPAIPLIATRKLHLNLTDNFYTASELARTLGLLNSNTIVRWVRNGWLKGSRNLCGNGRWLWCFTEEDIIECLRQLPWLVGIPGETLKHAHCWQMEKYEPFIARGECRCGAVRFFADVIDREILEQVNQLNNSTDLPPVPTKTKLMGPHYFRSIITEEWERDPWYTTAQAASLLRVANRSVKRYIERGWLSVAQKPVGTLPFFIRRSSIEAFLANDPRPRYLHNARSKASRSRLEKWGLPSRIGILWNFVCPGCGHEVEILAPPGMLGPQVREKFLSIYVNGACFHSATAKIELP